jgi:malonate transporter and related proteins
MGLPLLVTLVGPAAAGTMISTIVVDIVLTSSVCIALAQWQEASKHGHRVAIVTALRGAALNPLPWAIALGAASSATGLKPVGPIDAIVGREAGISADDHRTVGYLTKSQTISIMYEFAVLF